MRFVVKYLQQFKDFSITGFKCCVRSPIYSNSYVRLDKLCCGSYCFTTFGLFGSKLYFRPGKTFYEYVFGNGWCTSIVTIEGNKLFHVQEGKRKITIVREYEDDDKMLLTITVDDMVAKRYYQKTNDCVWF